MVHVARVEGDDEHDFTGRREPDRGAHPVAGAADDVERRDAAVAESALKSEDDVLHAVRDVTNVVNGPHERSFGLHDEADGQDVVLSWVHAWQEKVGRLKAKYFTECDHKRDRNSGGTLSLFVSPSLPKFTLSLGAF